MNILKPITLLTFATVLLTSCVSTSSPKLKPEASPPADAISLPRSLCESGNIAVTTSSTETLEPPHWIGRAADDYVKAAVMPLDDVPGETRVFVSAYDLVAMPVAALAGAIEGKLSKSKWKHCVQELSKDLADQPLAAELQTVLIDQLRTNGMTNVQATESAQDIQPPATGNRSNKVLQGEVREVRLVQSAQRRLVGIEVRLHFRILDAQAEKCFYDREFLQKSGFHRMKDYSGEPGHALFRQQLTDAMNAGVGQFILDIFPESAADEETQPQGNP